MSELFSEWIASIPPQTLVLVPLVAFLESCVVVGLFVSGVFLLTIVSDLCSRRVSAVNLGVPGVSGSLYWGSSRIFCRQGGSTFLVEAPMGAQTVSETKKQLPQVSTVIVDGCSRSDLFG